MKSENTIYIRNVGGTWKGFGKTRGEGFIIAFGGQDNTRESVIQSAGDVLWAINKFGPADYKNHAPLDEIPGKPDVHNYPVVEEKPL